MRGVLTGATHTVLPCRCTLCAMKLWDGWRRYPARAVGRSRHEGRARRARTGERIVPLPVASLVKTLLIPDRKIDPDAATTFVVRVVAPVLGVPVAHSVPASMCDTRPVLPVRTSIAVAAVTVLTSIGSVVTMHLLIAMLLMLSIVHRLLWPGTPVPLIVPPVPLTAIPVTARLS